MAAGGARQEAIAAFAHQPLVGVGVHVPRDVHFGPRIHPRLETSVQPRAHLLVRLRRKQSHSNAVIHER